MHNWIDLAAVGKILAFGLLIGAGLPALFAVGVRLNAAGAGDSADGGVVAAKHPVLVALSWLIVAAVVVAVMVGVLFIARDFIGAHTGLYLLGASAK